jgi:hypothetical protein
VPVAACLPGSIPHQGAAQCFLRRAFFDDIPFRAARASVAPASHRRREPCEKKRTAHFRTGNHTLQREDRSRGSLAAAAGFVQMQNFARRCEKTSGRWLTFC